MKSFLTWMAPTRSVVSNTVKALPLAVFFLSAGMLHAKGIEEIRTGQVTRVVDGDTVWVNAGGELLKVRITGIDAPEICQSGGLQARQVLRLRALGQPVTLISRRRDDYGRLLARVEHQGEDIGRWMVSQGHAWSYSYRSHPGPYGPEQSRAMGSRLGLFEFASPENPRDFRKRHGSCFP